jgi:hypothetical protein
MVSWLYHLLKRVETHAQRLLRDPHVISVLIYPHQMAEAALDNCLDERLRCTYHTDCPGKYVGAILLKKAHRPRHGMAQAQAYYTQRRGNHA